MGAIFNYIIVPQKIQNHKDLQKFYEKEKEKLLKKYGPDFEGYSGDIASDNDNLEIKENLCMKLENHKNLTKNKLEDDYASIEKIIDLIKDHAEKWGPSLAVKVNNQWVICGFYSD
jgi:hypothetical protein